MITDKTIYKTLENNFKPIGLADLDTVSLMNRHDTKAIFHLDSLLPILKAVEKDYFILEVNACRWTNYETLYFDTPNYSLYNKHHNGHLNRYKMRYRRYVESDLTFFEVKFKSNKKRTIKKRVVCENISDKIQGACTNILKTETPFSPNDLLPALWVYFRRMTLVSKDLTERSTIDLHLNYTSPNEAASKNFPNLIIIEIKQERFKRDSLLLTILKEHKIYPKRISKYCIGIASCNQSIKKNQFKSNLSAINKLIA